MTRFLVFAVLLGAAVAARAELVLCASAENDLYVALGGKGSGVARYDRAADAVARAPAGSGLLVLAEGYPARRTELDDAFFASAVGKQLRLYVEFPSFVPGMEFGEARRATWERVVVASAGARTTLPVGRILGAHACTFLPVKERVAEPTLVLSRVAGFDSAVFGLPKETSPILFAVHDGAWLIGTTKLSNFATGRYARAADWTAVWADILARVDPGQTHELHWRPAVRATYGPDDPLPKGVEGAASRAAAEWLLNSGLLIPAKGEAEIHRLLAAGAETIPWAAMKQGDAADGSRGILEGFASQVLPDGSQPVRLPIRADCNAESAMVLALEAWRGGPASFERGADVATNLLDYVYFNAPSRRGPRGDPAHPAFGLIAWGEVAPAWAVGNYGDDNARAILATIAASAAMGTDRYDKPVLRALLANLRTTGRLGFRGDRVDVPQLEKDGWRRFHDAQTVNYSPHFESGLWACYLWAFARTGNAEFRDKAVSGIRMTMAQYPNGWRLNDQVQRSRMLLCLAWLVRVEDTAEHRQWLARIAGDLLESQQPSGAIRERLEGVEHGHYRVPQSNEAYGTTETPLLQQPGDPVTDQLYTTGFALGALHEAAAATGDAKLKRAADALAAYLCRIQVKSDRWPELNGAWFRAFDDRAWECWASNADAGWGAWCVEAGWGPAWIAATLAMREKGTTLWEMTARSRIADAAAAVSAEMARNDGGPWKGKRP